MKAYLDASIDSVHTRRAYARHLSRAGEALGWPEVSDIDGTMLAAYRASVAATDVAPATKAQALAALRSFLLWVGDMGGHRLPTRLLRTALKAPRATTLTRYATLTDAEVERMFQAASTARHRAILGLMLGAGLRVAEVGGLTLADVIEDHEGALVIHVRRGKGAKDRMVPIRDEVGELVRVYAAETGRYLGSAEPLFLAKDRGAKRRRSAGLTTRALSRIIHDIAHDAGIAAKRVTPHALRHTYATRFVRAGGNVVALANLLGHANVATTQRYADHLAVSEMRAAVPALPVGSVN